ncbi:DNA double-strand break repair nuclease NurA [Candidatus Bathyarchaeota archaeon]|nr:DNA double-strand break repair nuclease NurA [Candidatus Bathyarchaeota archaeon]
MAEDIFFPLFSSALSSLKVDAFEISDFLMNVYASYWHPFKEKDEEYPDSFVVADGSYQSTSFQGGVRATCVRAIAVKYEGNTLTSFYPEVDVKLGLRLKGSSYYMKALELKCLLKALRDSHDRTIAIHDGTVYPTISVNSFAEPREQEVSAMLEWLNSLRDLYEFAMDHGHILIGLVKDSHVNYLRSRILVNCVAEVDRELSMEIARERSLKNIGRRLREEVLASENDLLKDIMKDAELMTSDEEVFEVCASEPGFTKPLALAPQPIYLSGELKAGTPNWRESRLRKRLESSSLLRGVSKALDDIYSMPPVVMFYWKPWHSYGIYRVDVSGWSLDVKLECSEMGGDVFMDDLVEKCEQIVSALNGLSPEPFAVKPLSDVDELVRLRRDIYQESYEPLLVDYLRSRGLRAHLTKRGIREAVFRRMVR